MALADRVDLQEAVAQLAFGIRIPKTESPQDVERVRDRIPAGTPLICTNDVYSHVMPADQMGTALWGPDRN
jgi:hypothetical protein